MTEKSDMRAICEAARAKVAASRPTAEPVREFAPDHQAETGVFEEFATVEDAMAWLRGEPKPSA